MSKHEILNPTDHGELRIHGRASAAFGDNVMACLAIPSEFRALQDHYPIVFRRDITTGAFSPMALFGFETGENLFLKDGGWDARYQPTAQSIQPFLIGRAASDGQASQIHIDMASPRISTNGVGTRVFDVNGQPTPFLENMAARLTALDYGYRQSTDFCATLDRYDLIEPFTLEVPLDDSSRNSLVGYHIIAEERLSALDGAILGDLQAQGYVLPIFMAVASLSCFSDLVARKNARLTRV